MNHRQSGGYAKAIITSRVRTCMGIALIGLAALSLSACGGGEKSGGYNNVTLSSVSSPTPAKAGETGTFVITGKGLNLAGTPVSADCDNLVLGSRTDTAVTVTCTARSNAPTFTVGGQSIAGIAYYLASSVSTGAMYALSNSRFRIYGGTLKSVAAPTSADCSGLTVTDQTEASVTFTCTPLPATVSEPGTMKINFHLTTATGAALAFTCDVPNPQVNVVTNMGSFTVELSPHEAPITVKNFLWYVNSGYYKNTIFHRVMKVVEGDPNSFGIVQGGGFTGVASDKSGLTPQTGDMQDPITLETNVGLNNTAGTIAMARTFDPNSAQAQFFVNVSDNSSQFDYIDAGNPGYAVFGHVVSSNTTLTDIN